MKIYFDYNFLTETAKPVFESFLYRGNFRFSATWDKEDFFQDVINKAWKNIESYDSSKGAFSTWFCTIGKNVYLDHYKSEKRKGFISYMEDENISQADAETCESFLIKEETKAVIHQEVDNLPDKYAEVIRMTYFDGFSAPEIAKCMHCTEMDVYRWRNRALNKLRGNFESKKMKDDLYDGFAA